MAYLRPTPPTVIANGSSMGWYPCNTSRHLTDDEKRIKRAGDISVRLNSIAQEDIQMEFSGTTQWSVRTARNVRRLRTAAPAILAVVGLAACGQASASPPSTQPTVVHTAVPAKSFAARNFTTNLRNVCPRTLTIQTNWLPEPDHGALYELIGGGGVMHQYVYEGPLGSTGIHLRILTGGPGNAYSPIPATLYAGNSVMHTVPQLGMGSADTAIQLSNKFPVTGVMALAEHDPLALIYDPSQFHNLNSIASLIAAAKDGVHFYVQSLQTGYVQYLISRGIPVSSIIGGFKGNLGEFTTSSKNIILGGFVDGAALRLAHYTPSWNKPVGSVLLYKLGFNDYDEVIEVANSKLGAMQGCLKGLVPLIQHAAVDYMLHPATVDNVLAKFNSSGYGAAFWSTPAEFNHQSVNIMRANDIVGNSGGGKGPIGAFDMTRLRANIGILLPIYQNQGLSSYVTSLQASQVATNKFIDPRIRLSQ